MSEIERHMTESNRLWYSSIDLIRRFGRDQLNRLHLEGKIEVRPGLNFKVVKLKQKTL